MAWRSIGYLGCNCGRHCCWAVPVNQFYHGRGGGISSSWTQECQICWTIGGPPHLYPHCHWDLRTLGPFCVEGQSFICEIGRRTTAITSDLHEAAFHFQRLSIAVRRYNAICRLYCWHVSKCKSRSQSHIEINTFIALIFKPLGMKYQGRLKK